MDHHLRKCSIFIGKENTSQTHNGHLKHSSPRPLFLSDVERPIKIFRRVMAFKVMLEHRHERDVNTYACANTDPRYDRVERLVIDYEKGHGEACEEKEQRKCHNAGNSSTAQERYRSSVSAIGKERPDPRSFMRTVSWLGNLHVPVRRLLGKWRQQRACEADGRTEEPERVDTPHIWRRERGGRIKKFGRGRDVRAVRISKRLIDICKVK